MNIETFGDVTSFEDLELGDAFLCFAADQRCIAIKATDNKNDAHAIYIPLERSDKPFGVELPTIGRFTSFSENPILKLPKSKLKLTRIADNQDQSRNSYVKVAGHVYQAENGLFLGVHNGNGTILINIHSGELSKIEGSVIGHNGWEIYLGDEEKPFFTWGD